VSALQAQRNSHELVSGPYNSPRFTKSLEVNPLPQGSRCSKLESIAGCANKHRNSRTCTVAVGTRAAKVGSVSLD
jgi:hypothetical protein